MSGHFDDGILDAVCALITDVASAKATAAHMLDVMRYTNCVGLSAPQIGVTSRLIVLNGHALDMTRQEIIMLNPNIIVKADEWRSMSETCTSFPGFSATIPRAKSVFVEYIDLSGTVRREEFQDIAARVVQHEVDHLDGITILDRAPRPIRKKYISSKRRG
jgi:peptide deformylase